MATEDRIIIRGFTDVPPTPNVGEILLMAQGNPQNIYLQLPG